jgi:hypothetical protein
MTDAGPAIAFVLVLAFLVFFILPHLHEQEVLRCKKRLIRAERELQKELELLIENPDDPAHLWRWR